VTEPVFRVQAYDADDQQVEAAVRQAMSFQVGSHGATLSFYVAILRCHRLPFFRHLDSNLAVTAVIFCRNDSVAPGCSRWWRRTRRSCTPGSTLRCG
jgi:hypothetical protein